MRSIQPTTTCLKTTSKSTEQHTNQTQHLNEKPRKVLDQALPKGVRPLRLQPSPGLHHGPARAKEQLAQDPGVQTALNKAAETFSEQVSEAFNEVLAEADELGTLNAVSAMHQITQNPDMVNRGKVTAFANNTRDQLSELFGSELADEISTINLAVANGVVSRARAAKTVMSNPDLMSAMLKASAAGIIQLGL